MTRLTKLAGAAILSALVAAPLLAAAPAIAATGTTIIPIRTCSTTITTADNGQTISMPLGSCDTLALDGGVVWSAPTVTGNAVTVTPVSPCIYAATAGTTAVQPICPPPPCPLTASGTAILCPCPLNASGTTMIACPCPLTASGTTSTLCYPCGPVLAGTASSAMIVCPLATASSSSTATIYPLNTTYHVNAVARGTSTISATGTTLCEPPLMCPVTAIAEHFTVTIVVK